MPYIIKVSRDFAVGAVYWSAESAFKAADKLGLVNYSVAYEPCYNIVGDNQETIKRLGTKLGTATDAFIEYCQNGPHSTYAMSLRDDNENVLLYWNGGMGDPEYTFIDPMEPAKADWMLEEERQQLHYWTYERPNEGRPEL